ncbi:MAG: segregation/condensation protein A [Chloroflexi bacterium]|nr:segregation/condensation protein A [Chloroflexota bacterium]
MQIAGRQTEGYIVTTPMYAGPLDLLLDLIERAELDITKMALAMVTDQYLEYLKKLPSHDAAEVSAFLVIAAKLIQIKSEALLPHPPTHEIETEEDLGESLARQLLAYKQFKRASLWLADREAANYQVYLRLAPPPKFEEKVDLTGIGINDLVNAALGIFFPNQDRPSVSSVVTIPLVTIRNKMQTILTALLKQGQVTFGKMVGVTRSRMEIVVTFLAMLELIKRHVVSARQEELFSEIELSSLEETNAPLDIEIEFLE